MVDKADTLLIQARQRIVEDIKDASVDNATLALVERIDRYLAYKFQLDLADTFEEASGFHIMKKWREDAVNILRGVLNDQVSYGEEDGD